MRKLLLCSILLGLSTAVHSIDFEVSRDPFEPYQVKEFEAPKRQEVKKEFTAKRQMGVLVKVTGIIWDSEHPMAVLTYKGIRKIVKKGDSFLDKKVVRITKSSVFLDNDGTTVKLQVGKEKRI